MEHSLQKPSDVSELMPCELDFSKSEDPLDGTIKRIFWSRTPNDELNYQSKKKAAPVVPSYTEIGKDTGVGKDTIKSIFERISFSPFRLIQFWSPVKVKGLTFLSTADQPFLLSEPLDKRLCSYRRHCLDNLIPVDIADANGQDLLAPPARVFIRGFPENIADIRSYSAVEFPRLQHAIQLGIQSYYAIPVFKVFEKHCLGVFEFASTCKYLNFPLIKALDLGFFGLYSHPWPEEILPKPSEPWKDDLDQIRAGLDVVCKTHNLPFAQSWIPHALISPKDLIATDRSVYDRPRSNYEVFSNQSKYCYIQRGKAVVGRAFSSQGSCFCKNVTLFSITEYPLVPGARKAKFTECFAICLQSKWDGRFVCVVECFLPPNEMVDRDAKTFLNMVLSTMKEQLPGYIVASGKELGQRIAVEVVKVSPSDELHSFEIGQPLPGVQSLQDGGETTEIDSLNQQSNLQNVKNNVTAEQLVHCSSHTPDAFNCERSVQVNTPTLVPHPTEEAMTDNVDVAHDDHIEFEMDRGEMIHPASHFEQPNVEFDITGNARSNDKEEHNDIAPPTNLQKIHSQKDAKQRIAEDHKITHETLEQHFGMKREDAATALKVSVSTLKRICREHDITRWPHHKTRKVNHHASKGVALQDVEPHVEDQECPDLSREKGKDYLVHRPSPATGKACDSVMKLKVEYGDDKIKFKLTPESTREDLEAEVEKRLKISLQKFTIKYQDEDDEWITIASDSDLRDGMDELRSLKRTTMRCKIVG